LRLGSFQARAADRLPALHLPQHPDEHGSKHPSSSQSIRSSAKVRVAGFPQYEPIRSTRSKSGSIKNVEQLGARSWPERV